MTLLTGIEEPEEDEFAPPPYNKPGRILVDVHELYAEGEERPFSWTSRWEFEVLDYDNDSGVFWINEGEGFDYWLANVEFPGPGRYLIADVSGTYYRGDGWTTDDDVDWNYADPVITDLDTLP